MLSRLAFRYLRPAVRFSSDFPQEKQPLIVERLQGDDEGIVVWALNRPKSKNAFSRQLSAELAQAFEEVRFDKNVRCLIVRSTSPGIFCAGADLKERRYIPEEEVGAFVARGRKFFREFQEMPIPTIAALDGFALGGGLEWAMGHDLRTAADEAKMGVTETKLAIIPGGGGTQNLTRLVGVGKAKELAFTARMIDGKEAERIGLVNRSVPQNESGDAAYQAALDLAREIKPNGPIALRMAKTAINYGSEVDLSTALAIEQMCYAQVNTFYTVAEDEKMVIHIELPENG
ncbi:unnamed protein product [Oikopleura dioica]|uniref:Uncharacterized protein n=1 Tax=Oikopleura dioica TaxID=34765 RepID=E4Z293_OIKDI|nr:unnamed protein product [Oikopleura dioica]